METVLESKRVKPVYEDYFDQYITWWPVWVAAQYFKRKTCQDLGARRMGDLAPKGNCYYGSVNPECLAPSKLNPVHRTSFTAWADGTPMKIKPPKTPRQGKRERDISN